MTKTASTTEKATARFFKLSNDLYRTIMPPTPRVSIRKTMRPDSTTPTFSVVSLGLFVPIDTSSLNAARDDIEKTLHRAVVIPTYGIYLIAACIYDVLYKIASSIALLHENRHQDTYSEISSAAYVATHAIPYFLLHTITDTLWELFTIGTRLLATIGTGFYAFGSDFYSKQHSGPIINPQSP